MLTSAEHELDWYPCLPHSFALGSVELGLCYSSLLRAGSGVVVSTVCGGQM